MAPKKGKEIITENSWRTFIEDARLDEENWKVKVIIIEAAGSDQDRIYLNKFETFSAEEKRFVIKNICKTETIFMINQLGGDKKVKDDNLRVFEEGQAFLKNKEAIPPDILALIIKHLILKMKEDNLFIRRQRLEVKQGISRESSTMINRAEVRGTVNMKSPEPDHPPAPPKAKSKKDKDDTLMLPEPDEGKKYNTVLRVRGEEWRDRVYVDDFPVDGPHLYVAVTGFVEPYLASSLIKIGIPLTAIVQVRIEPGDGEVPATLLRATKRGQSQTELLTEMSFKFWEDLQTQRISKNMADDFKNTAFVVFSPPYWGKESLSGNPEKIYDELSFLMYDVQDLTRQHLHYLDNMDIVSVPQDKVFKSFYRHYKQRISDLPLECVTMYTIVDCILRIVCEEKLSSESSSLEAVIDEPASKGLPPEEKTEKAEAIVKEIFKSLCKTDATKKVFRSTFGDEYETHKDPIVINYGDFVKNNTFHLGNMNLNNVVQLSLYCMPINKLWQFQDRPYGEQEAKINLHVNVLLSCFERADVETTELKRLIHILSCRKLYNNRSSLKKSHLHPSTISEFKKIYLKRSVLAEPLPRIPSITRSEGSAVPSFPSMTKYEYYTDSSYEDDPETKRIKNLFDCPDIRELVSATEIVSEKPHKHLIDDFEYFEDFFGVSALQVLTDAFIKFNCVDYKYCEVTDCFVLMFFNSYDMDGIAREEWRCHLMTPLCLQDFFDFDLEEHYDWIQKEEQLYDEKEDIKIQSLSKVNIMGDSAIPSCVDNLDVGPELLMEGSLKFQEAAELEDSASKNSESPTMTHSTKKTISPSGTDQNVRKTKSPASSTPKRKKKSICAPRDSYTSLNMQKKIFLGYDLGDRRVEAFGKDSTYFSKDGTRVKTLYTLVIPMNIEYISMEVIPGNGCNEFWLHRALGEVSQDILDTCESFRINCKDQMIIKLKKETYQLPVPVVNMSDTVKAKDDLTEKPSFVEPIFETESFHSLIITWPNGLITESVHELDSSQISHIKQFQTVPNTDEEMRCVSLNGEVVIFKRNGDIEMLKPDGTYIKILRYCKKNIVPVIPDDELSDVSVDKSKKVKKDKHNKTSVKSKSSDEEKLDEKPGEVELVIEEFELIEASGLRQKWVGDNSIDIEKYVVRTATDYCLGEIFSKRMDGMTLLLNKDGIYLVTFPNGTKIITYCIVEDTEIYPEWTEEEKEYLEMLEESDTPKSNRSNSQSQLSEMVDGEASFSSSHKDEDDINAEKATEKRTDGYISILVVYTIEHINFTTVTINKHEGKILLDSPNGSQVVAHTDNTFDITLDSSTKAKFNGQNLRISYEACPECKSFTTCDIKIKYDDISSVSKLQQKWLVMKDSFCKKVIVNEEGNICLIDEACSEETIPASMADEVVITDEASKVFDEKPSDSKSETSVMEHGKCREMYLAKTVKFFVQQRDLSCAELVHRSLLEQWQAEHRWQPWYSANVYDTFGDNRRLLSVLSPVHVTESEKWLMDSRLSNKPKHLTYKDLRNDEGKGWYHWMRPYERYEPVPLKPANVLPPRLPRAYILRVLEQQWSEAKKDKLKGAQELVIAILKYRGLMQQDLDTLLHMPIVDLRPEDERQIDDVLQALGERIYKELETRLDDDVRSRAKPNITTKPLASDDLSVEDDVEEEPDYTKILEQEREMQLAELEESVEMSPNLKRYWRRRKEEYNEQQFYLYLLREGSVPPYFRNVLGGAIWWEMNDTAGEAVTKAERNKMKCVCADNKEKKSTNT